MSLSRLPALEGTSRPRMCVEMGQGGAGIDGNTYNEGKWGRMEQLAGGTDAPSGHIPAGFAPMSPEYVLMAVPEHLFITVSCWAASPNAECRVRRECRGHAAHAGPYAERPDWAAPSATRNGEVHAAETGLARSLRDWTAARYIAKQTHPGRFSDVDPVAGLRRYHERFRHVRFEGAWMARLAA